MDCKSVKKYLENLSFFQESNVNVGNSMEYEIFKCLVGTSRSSRNGPFPDINVVETVCKNIRKNIDNNEPVQVVSAWGAKKTFLNSAQEVDLAEYYAMLQYSAIAEEIKEIYSPGVQYNIFLGDAYYDYIYGADKKVSEYCMRMDALAKIVNPKCLKIFFLSSVHKEKTDLFLQCDINFALLKDYWEESENNNEREWAELKYYKVLCEHGWMGAIPTSMRNHYLKRLDKIFPNFSQEEKILSILKFFAYGLMIAQNDIYGRKDQSRCSADFCLLRIPPPGMPKELHGNRLRKRIIPAKFTKKTAPPWTIAGGLAHDQSDNSYKPMLITFDETNQKKRTVSLDLFDRFECLVDIY